MTSFSDMIPIDQNGFFCTSNKSLEASTTDNVFSLEPPQCHTNYQDSYQKPNNEFDDFKKSAIVTPEKEMKDSIDDKTQNSKAEVTRWARGMLKAEPCSFVTQAGLLLALKHNAPAPVIQFMLKINPNIMNFPKMGPTPLQVAVQHNAHLDVVKMLLDASPVGECIRNADFPESPLEYVKRHHGDRSDLIDLLSRKSKTKDHGLQKKKKNKAKIPSDFNLFPRFSSFPLQQATTYKYPILSPPPSFLANRARAQSIISSSTASEPTSPVPASPPTNTPMKSTSLFVCSPPELSSRRAKGNNIISPFEPRRSTPLPEKEQNNRSPLIPFEPKSPTLRPKKDILSEVKISSSNIGSRSASRSQGTLPENRDLAKRSNIDREELNNIKTLCTLLWKAQRKMTKQLNASKIDIEGQSQLLATMGTKDEILQELMKQQRSQMFRNWIALDTKERSYQKRLEEMEQRYVEQLEKRLHSWTGSMRLWNESTREQLEELRAFVDSEAETNEYFRSNMTNWIEKYKEDQENTTSVPSEVFATNLGEVNQNVPLCAGLRGAFCGYTTDTTDGDLDPVIFPDESNSQLERVKKRSWRPIFKNRDYAAVE